MLWCGFDEPYWSRGGAGLATGIGAGRFGVEVPPNRLVGEPGGHARRPDGGGAMHGFSASRRELDSNNSRLTQRGGGS
jgi:hypothetical protein